MNLAELSSAQVQLFILVFIRTVTILSMLPVVGSANIPAQFKAGLALTVAALLFPFIEVPRDLLVSFEFPLFVVAMIKELLIGITIGFVSLFLMGIVQFAGSHIDNQIGFGMAQVVDPFSDDPTTIAGQYYTLIFSLVFLLVNGHYFLFMALARTFEVIPPLQMNYAAGSLVEFFSGLVAKMFILSLQLSAPVYAVLLISSLALGIVARTVPQMNVFFVGVPLKIALGLFVMAITLPAMTLFFKGLTEQLVEDIWTLIKIIS